MWYNSKKEILEHLGKNGRNTKYVDRMIEKGVIVEVGWQYAMRWSKEWEEWQKFKELDLVKKEEELKEKEEGYRAVYERFKEEIKERDKKIAELEERLNSDEDKVNLEYYKTEYEKLKVEYRHLNIGKREWMWKILQRRFRLSEDNYEWFCEEWDNL